jgi:hypothetical protein
MLDINIIQYKFRYMFIIKVEYFFPSHYNA